MEENIIPAQDQEKILTKEEIVQQKKQKFIVLIKKIKTITLITIFIILLLVIVRFIFLKTKGTYLVIPEEKPIEKKEDGAKKEEPDKKEEDTWEKFSSA